MTPQQINLSLETICWDGLFPPQAGSKDLASFEPLHRGQSILVTGAGGSIGSALSRSIFAMKPRVLVLLDSSEQNLYAIHRNLAEHAGTTTLVPVLGSVADAVCVRDVLACYGPSLVYHAAALKHVPLGEMNPFAVAQNNILATSVLAALAREHGVERLMMISTDKSVNPQSILGVSKRLAEMVLLGACDARTRMTSIRLGNVLGSEGSVVPLFLEQIACGGPVTVTDPAVERYFLTMEETVRRIFSAIADCPLEPAVAVPVMEQPVKIANLARYLIEQASAPNVQIAFTGLRPGDKLQEQFIAASESIRGESTDEVQWVVSAGLPAPELAEGLVEIAAALDCRDLSSLLAVLTRLVPEYRPSAYLCEQTSTVART